MKKLTFAMIIAIGALAFGQVERSDVGDGTNGHPIVRGPGIVINGTLGSGGNWPMSTSTTQTGRLNRNLVVSACGAPKACLIFDTTPGRAADVYTLTNTSGVSECINVTLDTLTMTACNLQVNAYINSYDPANICTNYLADPGMSSGTPPSPVPFSFDLAAGDDLILVVHTTNPGEIGCDYDLTITGGSFAGGGASPVPALNPAMIIAFIAGLSLLGMWFIKRRQTA